MSCDYSDFLEMRSNLEEMQSSVDEIIEACAKEISARLLRAVIMRTPVGDYRVDVEKVAKRNSKNHKKGDKYTVKEKGDKQGGTLRRGWISKTEKEAENGNETNVNVDKISAYVSSIPINKIGENYTVEIINPVSYASYVEYGHRQTVGRYVPAIGKKLKKGFVRGNNMLQISENEIRNSTPAILEKKINSMLKEYLNG